MKQKKTKHLWSLVLILAMALAMLLGMTVTANADTVYSQYVPSEWDNEEDLAAKVVNFNGSKWYIISDEGETITLLAADTSFGIKRFTDGIDNDYFHSKIRESLDEMTAKGGSFADVADAIEEIRLPDTSGTAKLYLLSVDEASGLPINVVRMNFTEGDAQEGQWWLRSPDPNQDGNSMCAYVKEIEDEYQVLVDTVITEGKFVEHYFGVRPALQLNKAKVVFDSESKTISIQKYPLWVGGTQVTGANAENILGDNTASYDDSTKTLTLNGATITDGYTAKSGKKNGIYYEPSESDLTLNINLGSGTTSISNVDLGLNGSGAGFQISGEGSLTANVSYMGISSSRDITISGGNLSLSSNGNGGVGISAANITISGGAVNASSSGNSGTGFAAAESINITGGIVTASGKWKAIYCEDGITLGNNVTADAGADEASAVPVATIGSEKWVQIKEITKYPLWVGDTQVTSANQDDVLASDSDNKGKVSFAPAVADDPETLDVDETTPATLTLSGANITTGHVDTTTSICGGVFYGGTTPLAIELSSDTTNTIDVSKSDASYGIVSFLPDWSAVDITITGEGSLTSKGKLSGISAGNVTINSGVVEAEGIEQKSIGIGADDNVIINGGKVIATGLDNGLYTFNGSAIINGGEVTATGSNKAISNKVKNAIPGTGWTDVEGTEGQATIAVSETGQELSSYKKVQFVPHTHSFTYEADGATITATCANTDGNCPLPESSAGAGDHVATLTIGAPTLKTYGQTGDGISPEATITDENSIQGDAKVVYYKATKDGETYAKDGEALSGAPTDAGDYIAEITLGVQNASHATASVGYTIAKADSTVTAAPQGKDITESGEPQELVTAGTAEGGEMQYALGQDDKTAPKEGWTKDIPKETKADTYYVWYKVVGDSNHNDIDPSCVTARIKPDKTELNNAITAAEEYYNTIKDKESYSEIAADLEKAIKDAKAVSNDPDASPAEVKGALKAIKQAKADAEAGKAAIDFLEKYDTLSDVEKVTTENAEKISGVLDDYDKLNNDAKKTVDAQIGRAGVQKLEDLAKALEVTDRIYKLKDTDKITLDDEKTIGIAITDYELLSDAQKGMIAAATLEKLQAAEQKITNLKAAEELKAVKASAVDRLNDYAEAKATPNEAEAYKEAVGEGVKAINNAADKDKVAEALDRARANVDTVLAQIEKARADAAKAATADEAANQAITDADKAAVDAKAAADQAAKDEYASSDDQKAINEAQAAVEAAQKAALELPATTTAAEKQAAAKAIEEAVKALNEATDAAILNSATARAKEEAEAKQAKGLSDAKTSALGRLEDFSEVKALPDFSKAEKTAYDQAVTKGQSAINAAADKDAIDAALKQAKKDVNAALDKIKKDRAEAKAKKVKTVTVNVATVNAKAVDKAVKKAGGKAKYVKTIVIGKKVKKIKAKAFTKYKKAKTLQVKTTRLNMKSVKNSLRGSKVTTIKVKVGNKKANKKYVKNYKKIFTAKNAGKKVKVAA